MMIWTSPGFCLYGLNNAAPISSVYTTRLYFPRGLYASCENLAPWKTDLEKKTVCFAVFIQVALLFLCYGKPRWINLISWTDKFLYMPQHQLLIALQNTARTDKSKNAANENSSKPPIIHSPWYEVLSGLARVHWFVIPPPPPWFLLAVLRASRWPFCKSWVEKQR